jgi:hypothetical protein
MSQAGIINDSGMPAVPTVFVTDAGNAVPALNVLNVVTPGGGTAGISTSGAGNTITVTLSGSLVGTGQTIGAVTDDLITIPLGAVPTTYIIEAKVVGFEATTPAGCGYNLIGVACTDGAAASIVTPQDKYLAENPALHGSDGNFVAVGNSIVIRVLGTIGLTIQWRASATSLGV